ncbi:MAG: SIS domain-containing protein [Patescibacteria group bacterium]
MNLDTSTTYKTYDPADVGFGIERLPDQVRCAWHDTREIVVPKSYQQVNHIVMCGMGGSALGPEMLIAACSDKLKLPASVVRDYVLPASVNSKTLVILSSFSGTTEEVLAAAAEARSRKAKLMVICTGGPLAQFAKEHKLPAYIFTPGDLAKQPRFGGGFLLVGILGLLDRAGLIKIKEAELNSMMTCMNEVIDSCAVDVKSADNPAKMIAKAIAGKSVLIVSSEHLTGNAHILQNSINENGKQFATNFQLPELNHHLLEGLTYPKTFAKQSVAVMLRSSLYHERTQKRYDITADLFEDQHLSVVEYVAAGHTRLDEVGEVLQFGSYVAWYLAMENKMVTTDIKFVDALKKRMAKS